MTKKIAFISILAAFLIVATGATFFLFQDRYAGPALADHCLTLTGPAFDHVGDGDYAMGTMRCLYFKDNGDGAVDSYDAYGWFVLPEGATIRQVQIYFADSGDEGIEVAVERIWRNGTHAQPLVFTTTGSDPQWRTMISPMRSIPYDNFNSGYHIRLTMHESTGLGTYCVAWVKIYYDMPGD